MPIITNNYLYEATTETMTKPVVAHRATVDFLTQCEHNCRGCFVNRSGPAYTEDDLIMLENIIKSVNETGMLFDELVIGPVDFFGALNSFDLMKDPRMQHILMTYKPIAAFPTTLMCDKTLINDFIDLFNEYYPHEYIEFELQVVINVKKFVKDESYRQDLKEKIRMFDRLTAHVCYTLAINVQSLTGIDLHKLSLMARDEFDTIIDYNPSFFRSRNPRTADKMIKMWNRELERQITPENMKDIQMVIADWSHGGYNYTNWIITNGQIFLSPFLHENVADTSKYFLVQNKDEQYTASDLTQAIQTSRRLQMEYAPKTAECFDCKYIHTCMARHVLYYMMQYNITDCVLPKKILDMYPTDVGRLAHEAYDWSDYSTKDEIKHGNRKHHEFAKDKGLL